MGFPHWKTDGSEELKVLSPNEIQSSQESSTGNVYNALWKESEEGVSSGTHYWKVTFSQVPEHSSPWIGLTDLQKFKKGWSFRGLMFGGPGNLSDGGGLLQGEFGPGLKEGDTVGMLVKFEEGKLKVYFDIDGKPLGLAFDLAASVIGASGGFPAVHFSGPGQATIEKCAEIPSNLSRPEPVFNGIEGDWKLSSYKGATPPSHRSPTLRITKLEGTATSYSVFLHVINNISFKLDHDASSGSWSSGDNGRISTLMGGSREDMDFEASMNSLTTNPNKVEVDPAGALNILKGDLSSVWTRYSTAKSPVTTDPFDRN